MAAEKPGKGAALASFPVPAAEEDEEQDEEQEELDEQIHQDEHCTIKVTQSPGYFCHIAASAAFRLPAETLFKQLICHPDNAAIYRTMDRCSYRRVLQEGTGPPPSALSSSGGGSADAAASSAPAADAKAIPSSSHPATPTPEAGSANGAGGAGGATVGSSGSEGRGWRWRRVEVEHEASWRFLLFSGKFNTRLLVEEDHEELAMRFELAQGSKSIMSKFRGVSHVVPHPKDPTHACMYTLDQDLALGVPMPPPFDRILKGISCSQIKNIFKDMQAETARINAGKPTLCPWEEVADKEIVG